MPIYEYHCKSCKKDFEVLQKLSEPNLAACPDCGKKAKRLISQTSFSLKGGGWHKDGYASKPAGAKSDSKPGESATKESSQKKNEKKADKPPPKNP
ncbi:MAG: zinc ribbon domain-containing protein [Pseudomonadota bacterium]